MGEVTIDSIQIEIESNSANASKGLDALAGSLEKLKKNGSFKTVSTNLNNLSSALKNLPNVHSAANSLRTLANSIEKLKGVGSVSSLTNSLSKLPVALKSVSNINLDKVAPQLQKVADTVEPISKIKAGGLNTMVNSMKKLGDVTKSLDDDTIAKFAEKVELLNTKLAPLSAKMATIKTGFNAINTSARKAADGFDKLGDGVNASALNLTSFIEIARTVIGAVTTLIQKLGEFIHQAAQWDGVKYQFGNAFGEQADEYYEKITRITEALNINKQAFMENSAMAASMLIGFGVDKKDAREMGLGYTQLAYDIWAAYNNVYETLDGADGAMAAVRSAIAGEVEPIRRAGFTIVEATLEQTAANHGLDISLQNATEAQKSYLRYLELVDQAQRKGVVGTYAREMQTAEGMMRTFSQQLKSLAQAFGSLFLPILVKVMPYVQAFVEILKDGVFWLAAFFGIEIQDIGDTWNDFSAGSGALDDLEGSANGATDAIDNATKAAKELKNATLGIDELNVISPQSSSSSGGGSGGSGGSGGGAGGGFEGLDIGSIWDESIFDGIQQDVDRIKDKIKDWLPVIAGVATALAGLKLTKLLEDVELAGFKLGNLGKVVSVAGIVIAVGKLVWDFTGAYLEGGDVTDLLKAIGTTVLGTGLAYWLAGKPGAAITLLASGVVTLTRLGIEIGEGTVEWNDTESLVTAGVGLLETVIGGIFTWKTIAPIVKEAWPKIAEKAAPAIAKAGPYGWIAAAVVAGIVLAFVDYDFTPVGRTIGEKVGEGLVWAFENLTPLGLAIKFGKWLMKELDVDTVWGLIKKLFEPETWTEKIFPEIEKVFTDVSEWINGKIENLRGNIDEFFAGFFDGLFDGLGVDVSWAEKFAEFFDIEYTDIIEMIMNPSSIGEHIMTGIENGIKEFGGLFAIQERLSAMWNNAKAWWDTKKGNLSTYIPSIGSISSKLSEAWESAKTWWSKKGGLSTYTPGIGKIWENLKASWETAKTWWSKNRGSLTTYTPSIGKIWEKLKTAWTSAKDWWNKNRSNLSTYTPSIGSISSKLSSAWSSAKTWWGKKSGLSTYTPSIGSIKDKLSSAWSTAKSWWNNNVKLSIPSMSFKVTYSTPSSTTMKAIMKALDLPGWPKLSFAADGGIFDAGSLIWAGERGPEIVANASGGKTGVMNVQQMQEAVYEGVYAAMMSAMRGSGDGSGSQVVKVYLDGKEITHTVEQHQRERGASIMGNEVYSY